MSLHCYQGNRHTIIEQTTTKTAVLVTQTQIEINSVFGVIDQQLVWGHYLILVLFASFFLFGILLPSRAFEMLNMLICTK